MPVKFCPGAANISGTPTLKVKKCPDCGTEVELFSTDQQRICPKCGFIVYNDILSCIRWCKSARECVGDEMYERLIKGVPE
jgi:ribosomal protein S27AE